MTSPVALIELAAEAGFRIDLTPNGPQLVRTREDACIGRDLLADLKANRVALVRFLATGELPPPETCRVCGRDVSDPEYRALLADPAHCDRGGTHKATTDAHGGHHPATPRCPFKPGRAA